ncbi:MAG: hypothetical protein ACLRL6_11765 [Clostridium sp.]
MKDKDYWYHCGVMDAFCEIVAAGVKKLALSHPINSKEDLNSLLPYAKQLCRQYGIQYYEERELLITDLFPFRFNKDHYNILFYRDDATLDAYLALKRESRMLFYLAPMSSNARSLLWTLVSCCPMI